MTAEENLDIDLPAASLRADGTDLSISIAVLAAKLESTLPGRTRVERRGSGLLGRGEKHVRSIQVELGADNGVRYELMIDGERVAGFRERKSGGISIKREPLDPDQWVAALTAELRAEAERSSDARSALEALVR
jgi:hypothetical protein